MKKWMKQICSVMICIGMAAWFLPKGVRAEDDTQVLEGELSGMVEIADTVTKVILNGVSGDEETSLYLDASAVIEVADGTENTLGSIVSLAGLELTGGGNLTLSKGIATLDGDLIDNHTGNLTITGGSLVTVSGTISVNSGTLDITPEDDESYSICSSEGNVELNGGNINVSGDGYGIAAGGGLEVADEVNIEGVEVQKIADEDGRTAYAMVSSDGQMASSISASGADSTNVKHIETGIKATETEETASEESANTMNKQGIIVLAGAAVIIIAAAGLMIYLIRKQKKDKQPVNNKGKKQKKGKGKKKK